MNTDQRRHVFGPVNSRRLGSSLGIDPIPAKTCNWNCVYCQLGRTVPLRCDRKRYLPTGSILSEVEFVLSSLPPGSLDWVTFVGSGEPLLHADLGLMIRGVKDLTEHPVAVITNGSLLSHAGVRRELSAADAVLPTLDAGTAELYRRINRPHPRISFLQHVQGLQTFRQDFSGQLFLEVMLVEGLNDSEPALELLAGLAETIEPDQIHISVPERPPAEPWVRSAPAQSVARAARILGEVSTALVPGEEILVLNDPQTALQELLRVIGRHPLSVSQVSRALATLDADEGRRVLEDLEKSSETKRIERQDGVFWVPSDGRFPEADS